MVESLLASCLDEDAAAETGGFLEGSDRCHTWATETATGRKANRQGLLIDGTETGDRRWRRRPNSGGT